MKTHDPFAPTSGIESFEVISESFEDGQVLPEAQRSAVLGAGGRDESPQLTWSGAPEGTRSYAVTVFDPDAPGAGYWHWAAVNIPADVTSLPAGAGSRDNSRLPSGAVQLKNDAGFAGFVGAAPPPGHGQHRYLLVVHAMDVERLDLRTDDTPASLQSALSTHTLGRARLTGTFERR
jgi:Raf kinase inhibitor-like YbhB/YbcL family protein